MSSSRLNDPSNTRDYGATNTSHLPDVNFSGFSPTEFITLSENIGQTINAVNSSWKRLEKMLKDIGTPNDRQAKRDEIRNIQDKANGRIEATSKDLERLTLIARRGDQEQKMRLDKLTREFSSVVDKYSSTQKRIVTAMRQSLSVYRQSSRDDTSQEQQQLQTQMQIEANLQEEEQVLIDRSKEIDNIETDIRHLNQIMVTVATMVNEQATVVDTIERTVEIAATDVESGAEELAKANALRQGHQRKICILLIIAVIIGLIVTGIVVASLYR